MIAGAFLGLLAGYFGTGAAMLLAGGGHSHNDLFIVFESAVVWMIVGGVFGPKFLGMVANSGKRVRLYALGMIGSVFAAGTALYHAVAIAPLSPDHGGPIPRISPAIRAQLALAAAAFLGVLAVVLLIRMIRTSRSSTSRVR